MAQSTGTNLRMLRLRKLNNAMQAQLGSVDAVSGVQGWTIGNDSGEALVSTMPGAMDQRTLDTIGRHVSRSSAGVTAEDAMTEIEIDFSGGHFGGLRHRCDRSDTRPDEDLSYAALGG